MDVVDLEFAAAFPVVDQAPVGLERDAGDCLASSARRRLSSPVFR
jgi:hypothetical protein